MGTNETNERCYHIWITDSDFNTIRRLLQNSAIDDGGALLASLYEQKTMQDAGIARGEKSQ